MFIIPYQRTQFLTSVAELSQLPPDIGAEVAFVGRSNAGKSSALNALTQQNHLAKTSKTPGRTQLINFFTIDEERKLVDLPGYGYAKVPAAIKKRWQNTLHHYLTERHCLKGLILLIDSRHPLKPFDYDMLALADSAALPVHILLTKSDKLSKSEALNTLKKVKNRLKHHQNVTQQLFSATKKIGLEELVKQLALWLNDKKV